MNNKSPARPTPLLRMGRVLSGLLMLVMVGVTGTPASAIADDRGSTGEVRCPNKDPLTAPVWRNLQALVDQEYTSGPAGKRLKGDALALAYGHALGRAALAQGDDPIRQEAVACLQLALDQKYARLLIAYGPTAESRRKHLYHLVQSTAMGFNDDLVAKYTSVTSRTPAPGVFGATAPWQPPQAPGQPVVDGQYCATISANAGWQAVAIPTGFNGIIQVEGNWNVHHAHATVGPEGYSGSLGSRMDRQYPQHKYERGLPFAALMMRNGPNGPVSWVQSREHMAIATGPDFQFRINDRDDALSDNKGALTVCMSVGQHGMGTKAPGNPGLVSPAEWKALVDACKKGASGPFSVAKARDLVRQAERASLPRECYETQDYLACKQVDRLLNSALDQLAQVLMVSRSSVGQGCRYCDLKRIHDYSSLGNRIDRVARDLYRKGLRPVTSDTQGWHFHTLESEELCKAPPPRPTLSVSPVTKNNCPGHCAAAAPACNYAYYNAKTQQCSWADGQSAPNLAALSSGDIWDRAQQRWLGQSTNPPAAHLCKDAAIPADAEALMYARGSGGGHVSYTVKRDHLCLKQSYSKISGSSVAHYACKDESFTDCSLKSTDSVKRESLGNGAYKVIFDDGRAWWNIWPLSSVRQPAEQPTSDSTPFSRTPATMGLASTDWPNSRTDFASVSDDLVFHVGMGSHPKWGYGYASLELADARGLIVEMLHAPGAYKHYDQNSFAGFVIDYYTDAGSKERVMLGIGMYDTKRNHHDFIKGTGNPRSVRYIDLGRHDQYPIDLSRWAPSNWNGRALFAVGIQNAGENNSLKAKLHLQ